MRVTTRQGAVLVAFLFVALSAGCWYVKQPATERPSMWMSLIGVILFPAPIITPVLGGIGVILGWFARGWRKKRKRMQR